VPLTWDEDKSSWSGGPAITPQPVATADPVPAADFNALAARLNALLVAARDAGLIATD
jgi:hypothetical protein